MPDGATAVQVLPADPRGRQPRRCCGPAWPTGTIDCVVSDHSPCTAELKRARHRRLRRGLGRDRLAAARPAGGVDRRPGGAATAAPTWSAGWPSAPAELAGLRPQGPDRGRRRRRPRALFAPDETFVVDPARLHHRHPVTPYAGRDAARRRPADVAGRARRSTSTRAARAAPEPGRGMTALSGPSRVHRDATSPRCPTWPRGRSAAAWSHANDELFAERENLIRPEPAGLRTRRRSGHKGKVYDGWETRRRREPGHDHAIVRLGVAGRRPRRGRRHRLLPRQLPAVRLGRGAPRVEGYPSPGGAGRRGLGDPRAAVARSRATPRNAFAVADRPPLHPRAADDLPRRRGGPAARARRGGARPAAAWSAPSTWPRWSTAATSSTAPTGSTPRRATCCCPAWPASMGEGWETARRRDDGND